MTRKAPIGFGLLGTGLIAPFHARAIQASKRARLLGATDLDSARLAKFTNELRCRAYVSAEEMLADPAIQIVNVLTPNHLHTKAVVEAARAGKHVLIEKPPATSLRELDTMQAAGRSAGVKMGVVFQCRTLRAVQAIRDAIRKQRFGKIYEADAFMKWYRPSDFYHSDAWRGMKSSGAGVTFYQAIHYIDLLQYLVGPVKTVQAKMTNYGHPDIPLEDTLLASVNYESGAQGVVVASTAFWPGMDVRIEINGEAGTAVMVGEHIEHWQFREALAEDEEIRGYGSDAGASGATGLAGMSFRGHQAVIEDMVEAIEDDREPMISLASTRPTLEWALAMYISANSGSPVDLPIAGDAAAEALHA